VPEDDNPRKRQVMLPMRGAKSVCEYYFPLRFWSVIGTYWLANLFSFVPDGCYADGREWRVDWATPDDFKFFGWKWTEGDVDRCDKVFWFISQVPLPPCLIRDWTLMCLLFTRDSKSYSRSRSRSPQKSGRSDSPSNTN